MKKLTCAGLLLAIGLALYLAMAGSAQDCERPACRAGDRYSASRHRCESNSSPLSYPTHYAASCPNGYELDESRGVCVQRGECCTKRACTSGFVFRGGRCTSGLSSRNDRPDYVPDCGAGWELQTNGFCRKLNCPSGGMLIERIDPETFFAGSTVDIYGREFGIRQDDRVLSINRGSPTPMKVEKWASTLIRARVPAGLAPGRYQVLIYYDDQLNRSSNSVEVTVRRR